jgi:hypothetical protein
LWQNKSDFATGLFCSRLESYARAASGHAAAAPPRRAMKLRRSIFALLRNSIQKIPVESMIAVSSIRVRSAHGNSLDHLVGA